MQTNPRLISRREAAHYLGVSPQTLSKLPARHPGFPPPIKLARSSERWDRVAIDQWLSATNQQPATPAQEASNG